MESERLQAKLELVPAKSGVYLFRDSNGSIVYIGKGKNLRSRVRSYFRSAGSQDQKTKALKRHIADFEFIVTDTDVEALMLESTLVKKHRPRFNVNLKDDKSFLHIKLTINEPFPRVRLTRRVRNDGALYFGPYLPASLARNTIKIINRHFQLRTCDLDIDGRLERPCLEYHIKRCLGPCVDGLCSLEDYRQAVREVVLLLEGKNEKLIRSLTERMVKAADQEHFEAAAFFRDRIQMVRDLGEKQKMIQGDGPDVDLFAYHREGSRIALQLFTLREGRVVGRREFFWEDLEFFDPAQFLSDAIRQYYLSSGFVPREIHLPCRIEDEKLLEQWLSERRGRRVYLRKPQRGGKHDLLRLVEQNARVSFETRFKTLSGGRGGILESLRQALDLPAPPSRIEAFDVSNIQGSETVAALVVCQDGRLSRSDYRKFRIQSVHGPDDFASIQEVVHRRYRRLQYEGAPLPDLILIDGGKGQLHAAFQALSRLNLDDIPLVALAKREEKLFLKGSDDPVVLDRTSPVLHLLQEIRDEVHRFAVGYHRQRRSMRDFHSQLDDIPGIGEKRKTRLLRAFGSIEGIAGADLKELAPIVGEKLAQVLKVCLNSPEKSSPSELSGRTQ